MCVASHGETHSWTLDSADGTRLEGGSCEGTAGTRGARLVFGKTRIALLANFQLTCAPVELTAGALRSHASQVMPRRAI